MTTVRYKRNRYPLGVLERKGALVAKGVTHTEIARELGVPRPRVSMVIGGFQRHRRIEDAVAEKLGLPVGEVFAYRSGVEQR